MRLLTMAVMVVGLLGAAGRAAPQAEPRKEPETAAERVRKALDQTLDVDIEDQPLGLAVAQLREQTKLNLVLDQLSVTQTGFDPQSTAVSLKLHKTRLRSALRLLLGPFNLSYVVLNDTV